MINYRDLIRQDTERKQLAAYLRPYGLDVRQWKLLCCLKEIEPTASNKLAAELHVSHPAVTVVVDGLVLRGFVERQRSKEDSRSVRLSCTQAARKLLDVIASHESRAPR